VKRGGRRGTDPLDETYGKMRTPGDQTDLNELIAILADVGQGGIWRPIYDPRGRLLAHGIGDPEDGLGDELPGELFAGKRVIDIGCNFGAFSFYAARRGAAHVLGVDIDARIIRGCRILKGLFGLKNVDFLEEDLTRLNCSRPYDLGMMIDFIGKFTVRSGFLRSCLDVMEALSKEQMLLSLRPVYVIDKHLGGSRSRLLDYYPAQFVLARHFLSLDYVRHRFGERWDMQVITNGSDGFDEKKQTVLFVRR